jgi:kinetochore protein Spc25
MKKKDIEILQIKTAAHQQTLEKESAETAEIQSTISMLTERRDAHLETRSTLQTQMSETQSMIDSKLSRQRAHAAHLNTQARFDVPELDFWQQHLGLLIEGAGKQDRLKFIFTQIDEMDYEREAYFELNTASRDYDIRTCRPKLEKERTDKLIEAVNEKRDLGPLVKGMRELFVEAMKTA